MICGICCILLPSPAHADMNFLEWFGDAVVTDGLDYAYSVAVSPDSNHVYVAGFNDNAVAVFRRNSTTGALTYVEVQKDGVGGVDGLATASSVVLSPNGKHVYVAGKSDNAVAVFSRNSSTGALTYVECHKDGVGGVDGLSGSESVTVSPDGKYVYAAGEYDDALAIFSRNASTGALTYEGMHQDGAGDVDGLDGAYCVAVSPNGSHLYMAGLEDDSLAVFDLGDHCVSVSPILQLLLLDDL